MPERLIDQFDRLIRRDPARRGLIGHEPAYGPLCAGHLQRAALHLAREAEHVGLVTGFYVPHGQPPAAETDGPPGTLLLAKALEAVGVEATVLTDEHCFSAVRAAAFATGFPLKKVVLYGRSPGAANEETETINDERAARSGPGSSFIAHRSSFLSGSGTWIDEFFTTGRGRTMTHLIAVERVGPSHTRDSLVCQKRDTPPPLDNFAALVPDDAHNRHHNMRGQTIDEHTADMYRLFDELHLHRPEAKTIGIGDGGNEIGMGSIPWEELHRRMAAGERSDPPAGSAGGFASAPTPATLAGRIPCRVPTDWTIIAGTSNWGAYALAAALLSMHDAVDALRDFGRDHQRRVLQEMVAHGPAVDGATGRREATVDGLPFLTYIQPWEGIRRLLGLPS